MSAEEGPGTAQTPRGSPPSSPFAASRNHCFLFLVFCAKRRLRAESDFSSPGPLQKGVYS